MNDTITRHARVGRGQGTLEAATLDRYLPDNYSVTGRDDRYFYITGTDRLGWTLDDYVIPRLASGLIWCEEISAPPDLATWPAVEQLIAEAREDERKRIIDRLATAQLGTLRQVIADLAADEPEHT